MASIWLKIKFRVCQAIYFALAGIVLVVAVYRLDTQTTAPLWVTVTAGVLLLLLCVFLNFLYTTNLSRILCRAPAEGILLDQVPFYIGSGDGVRYQDAFMDLLEVRYTWNGRTRRRRLLCTGLGSLPTDAPVQLLVCRFFPRIIYVKG